MALWVNKSKNISDQKGSSSLLAVWGEESLPSPYIKDWADQGQVSVLVRLWVVLISGLWLRAWEVRFFRHEGWWRSPSAHQNIPSPSTALTPGKCLQRRWSNVLGAAPSPAHLRPKHGNTAYKLSAQVPAFCAALRPRRCPLGKLAPCSEPFKLPICHSSPGQSKALLLFVPAEPPARASQIFSPCPELTVATSKMWLVVSKSPPTVSPSLEFSLVTCGSDVCKSEGFFFGNLTFPSFSSMTYVLPRSRCS